MEFSNILDYATFNAAFNRIAPDFWNYCLGLMGISFAGNIFTAILELNRQLGVIVGNPNNSEEMRQVWTDTNFLEVWRQVDATGCVAAILQLEQETLYGDICTVFKYLNGWFVEFSHQEANEEGNG